MAGKVTVDKRVCKGCELCVHICPEKIMVMNREIINEKGYNPAQCASEEQCIACGMCGIICPESAITVERM